MTDSQNDLPATVLDERVISDVESLRALSDPLRLQILETMTRALDETFTVKRLAAAIGTSPTKLYHHVNVLVERELVLVAGQRVVSGIIETSYRAGQRGLRLDRSLLAADAPVMHETLVAIFDSARDDIERSLRAGVTSAAEDADPAHKLLLARGLTRLTPELAVTFRERLVALFEEFGVDAGHAATNLDDDTRSAYGMVIGLYAMADPRDTDTATDTDDDGETDR